MNFFLRCQFIQNLYVFKTNNNLNSSGINYTSPSLLKKIKLNKKIKVNLFGDSLYKINLK